MGRLIGAAAAALALALALTACTGDPGSSAPSGSAGSPGSVQDGGSGSSSTMPIGLYGLGSSHVASSEDALTIDYPGPCDGLLTLLETGQWSVDPFVTPTGALNLYLVALSRSGHSAILRMSGSETICHGTLATSHQEKVRLSGDEDAQGTAEFLPFGCLYQDLETTTIALTGLYDLEDLHLMVSVAFVADTGEVDPESIEVGLQHGTESTLATLGRLTGAGLSGEEDFDESEMIASGSYHPGDDVDAEVALSSQDPLTGTIAVSGLVNDATGTELSVTTGFRCTP
jgi:hypothetical protein